MPHAQFSQESIELLFLDAAIAKELEENETAFESMLAAIMADDELIRDLGAQVHQAVLRREGRRAKAQNLMARQTALEGLKRKLGG